MPRMIDADDALEKIEKIYESHKNSKNEIEMFVVLGSGIKTGLDTAIKILEDAPTIEAEPVRHGHLIGFQNTGFYECSVCGGQFISPIIIGVKYCQYCGAKLDEVSE